MQPIDYVSLWLADFHLVAALLLAVVLACLWRLQQPAQRMAVVRSTLAALAGLLMLTALPGWSLFHLPAVEQAAATPTTAALPATVENKFLIQPRVLPIAQAPSTVTSPAKITTSPPAPTPVNQPAAPYAWDRLLLAAYAAGSLLVLSWLAVGSLLARRVRLAAVVAPAELQDLMAAVAGQNANLPALLVSDRIAAPVALGVRRPAILLPTTMLSPATAAARDELAAVLAHEWSHLRNGDLRTLAASRLLLALLWPQPLFWLLRRQLRLDQETLADAAAAELAGRVPYAERLLGWARQMNDAGRSKATAPRLAGAVGLWEGPSQLKRRIATLLDERLTILRQCSPRWRWMCGAGLALAAIGLSLVTLQPASQAADDEPLNKKPQAEADDDPATRHQIQGPATINVFRAGPPPETPTFKKNAIVVQAVDGEGKPIEGVDAILFRASLQDGSHEQLSTTTTNSQGEASFENLVPAEDAARYLEIEQRKEIPPSSDPLFLVALRKPGLATALVNHARFDVALRGAQKRVSLGPAAELRGTVTDENGAPVAGATVAAGGFSGTLAIDGVNAVKTDAQGLYVFSDRPVFDAEAARADRRGLLKWSTRSTTSENDASFAPLAPGEDLAVTQLVVSHPDFAVATVQGDDVPGTTDIPLAPAAAIAGRVINFETGKPAAGINVIVHRRPTAPPSPSTDDWLDATTFHTAKTRTDADGRYRLANLPAARYDVWAQPDAQQWSDADWVCRGVSSVEAKPGTAATQAPDLTIGPGGVIRVQLVDAETGKPLQAPVGAVAMPYQALVGGPDQYQLMQRAPLSASGQADLRVFPGKSRLGVIGFLDGAQDGEGDYRTRDRIEFDGAIYEVDHVQTIEIELPVYSSEAVEAQRTERSKGYELLQARKFEEALAAFDAALTNQPDDASVRYARAAVLDQLGRSADSIAEYEKLIQTSPEDPVLLNNLASQLATATDDELRDGARAVKLAERAVALFRAAPERQNHLATALDTLASANAEAGDFAKAIAIAEEAFKHATDKQTPEMQSRLELYRAGKPYRRAAITKAAGNQEAPAQSPATPKLKASADQGAAKSTTRPKNAKPESASVSHAYVRVVNRAGQPVEGAVVTLTSFMSIKGASAFPGEGSQWTPPAPQKTDSEGKATISYTYPPEILLMMTVRDVLCSVEHPDYVTASAHTGYDDDRQTRNYVLDSGAQVEVTARADGQELPGDKLFVQCSTSIPRGSRTVHGNSVRSGQFKPERSLVRAVYLADDGTNWFSPVDDRTPSDGETYRLDLAVQPGVRVEGRLDDSVPRPVKNGWAVVAATTASAESPTNPSLCWCASAEIASDGTFAIDGLPRGDLLELVALCDGYFAKTEGPAPDGPDAGMYRPQAMRLAESVNHVTLAMAPTATCEVKVNDLRSRPIADAVVSVMPNVSWRNQVGGLYGQRVDSRPHLLHGFAAADAMNAHNKFAERFSAKTDAAGKAVIANLPVPEPMMMLVAGSSDHMLSPLEYVTPFFGPPIATVSLKPGETTRRTLSMRKTPSLREVANAGP